MMRIINCLLNVVTLALLTFVVGCQPDEKNEPTPDNKDMAFRFEMNTTTHTSVATNIIPEDKSMEYIVFLSELKHFYMNGIDTEQELLEDDYLYFYEMAAEFEMPMRDFLQAAGWLTSGDKLGYRGINLYPDTDYIVYCYGVQFDGEYYTATTDICYTQLRTTTPELRNITFATEHSVDGNVASFRISPNDYDGYYYHYIIPDYDPFFIHEGMEITDEYITYYRNMAADDFQELIDVQGVSKDNFCHKGVAEFSKRLDPNTNYMLLTFAVSDDQLPILCSAPEVCYFTTQEPLYSELSIDIEITDITPYEAQLTLTPSSDEPYACVFLTADQFPNSEDDLETMNKIIEYYLPAIFTGEHREKLTPLMPSSEYVVAAFGCDGENPTSELFVERFTTPAQQSSDVYITSIDILKIFDIEEVAAIDSAYEPLIEECECLVVVEAKTNVACDKVYYFWFEDWMRYEYSNEAFLEDLMMYEPTPSPTVMTLWYSTEVPVFFAGIAEDEGGNISDIYYGDIVPIERENCSPAAEFFDMGIEIYKPEFKQ